VASGGACPRRRAAGTSPAAHPTFRLWQTLARFAPVGFSRFRLEAVSAAATDRLARRNAQVFAILGAGVQAHSHLEALREVQPPAEVRVGSRTQAGADRFAAEMREKFGDERRTVGVLAVLPTNVRRVLLPEQSHLLGTFAGQIALALERARLAEVAEASSLAAERETLRNTLLASISHDLRTPLAVIAGAGSTLAQHGATLEEATRVQLARSVETKAREMSELVANVLELVRLESGQVVLRRDWQTLDDLVGSALTADAEKLAAHRIGVQLPAELPPVWVDATLIVQVFTNLFDNIAKYTPPGTRATLSAAVEPERDYVRVTLDDEGPGLPTGDPARLFDKFQRGSDEGTVVGVGLGLAICQAVVRAHGGEIEAQRRLGGGARLTFTLPCTQSTP